MTIRYNTLRMDRYGPSFSIKSSIASQWRRVAGLADIQASSLFCLTWKTPNIGRCTWHRKEVKVDGEIDLDYLSWTIKWLTVVFLFAQAYITTVAVSSLSGGETFVSTDILARPFQHWLEVERIEDQRSLKPSLCRLFPALEDDQKMALSRTMKWLSTQVKNSQQFWRSMGRPS
jgi:hypothetical protein